MDTSTAGTLVASPSVLAAAALLLQAYDYARNAQADPWQFAVDRSDLPSLTILDLRWLLARRFVEHAQETTVDGNAVRTRGRRYGRVCRDTASRCRRRSRSVAEPNLSFLIL